MATAMQQVLNNFKQVADAIEAWICRPFGGPILFLRTRDSPMAELFNEWPLMHATSVGLLCLNCA